MKCPFKKTYTRLDKYDYAESFQDCIDEECMAYKVICSYDKNGKKKIVEMCMRLNYYG
jgi:hypothetical protein